MGYNRRVDEKGVGNESLDYRYIASPLNFWRNKTGFDCNSDA